MAPVTLLFAGLAILAIGAYLGFAVRDLMPEPVDESSPFLDEFLFFGDALVPPSTTDADVAAQTIFEIDGWSVASGPAEIEVVERITPRELAMG